MKKFFLFLLTVIVIAGCAVEKDIQKIHWLQGEWQSIGQDGMLVENWTVNKDNSLTGHNYTLELGDTTFSEQVEIGSKNENIYFSVLVYKSTVPVNFKLIELSDTEMVFEDSLHDFPQRIVYKLVSNDSLYARIEGIVDGKKASEEFFYKKVGKYIH